MGTQVTIENPLLYPNSTRTLLSYRDIRKNGLHIVTYVLHIHKTSTICYI
jgi:hypothetical protein